MGCVWTKITTTKKKKKNENFECLPYDLRRLGQLSVGKARDPQCVGDDVGASSGVAGMRRCRYDAPTVHKRISDVEKI